MSRLLRALCLLATAGIVGACGGRTSAVTTASTPSTRAPAGDGGASGPVAPTGGTPQPPRGVAAASAAAPVTGGQGPVATATAAASAAAAAARTAASDAGSNPVVALGDSITFGWGRGASQVPFGPAPAHSYPWYLARDLDLPVVNAGVSGTTAHEVLDPGSEPNHPRPPALQLPGLLALHPRLMIVSFGSNEVQRGWPMWEAAADLDHLLARIAAAGVPMVVVGTRVDCFASPCPPPGPGYTRQRYLDGWDATLTQLAGRYQAGLVLDVERGFTADDLTDWIHPTAIGYWRMAQRIEPVAVSVLAREAQHDPGGRPAPRLPGDGGWTPPPADTPDAGRRDPRPQSDIWPGGPHEFRPWTLDGLLSLVLDLVSTPPEAPSTGRRST